MQTALQDQTQEQVSCNQVPCGNPTPNSPPKEIYLQRVSLSVNPTPLAPSCTHEQEETLETDSSGLPLSPKC